MKLNKIVIMAAGLLWSSVGYADDYRFELGGAIGQIKLDYGGDSGSSDVDMVYLNGKFHFAAVSNSGQPMAEDAFLAKSSSISLTHNRIDGDGGSSTNNIVFMEFYIPGAMLYLAPFYLHTDNEDETDDNTYGTSVGITPIDGLRIHTLWVEDVDYELNVEVKYVKESGAGKAVAFELGYAQAPDSEYDDYMGAAVDYYLDPSFSIGGFFRSSISSQDILTRPDFWVGEDALGVRTEKFVNSNISLYGSISTSDEINTWNIGVQCRL